MTCSTAEAEWTNVRNGFLRSRSFRAKLGEIFRRSFLAELSFDGSTDALITTTHRHTVRCCRVSRWRMALTTPDAQVIAAITHIAPARPKTSAITPANNAPTA